MESEQQKNPGEELHRMSFGDHLDELRKRMIRALLAVLVCIVVVVPFKDTVGEVVIGPYRGLWRMCFADYIQSEEDKQAALAAQTPPTLDLEGAELLAYSLEHRDEIMAGNYPRPQMILLHTGFAMPYSLMAIGGLEDFWIFMMMSFILALLLASPVVLYQVWSFIAAGLYKKERGVIYRCLPLSIGLMLGGVMFGYFVVVRFGLYFLVKLMNPDQVMASFTVSLYFNLLFTLTAALGIVFQLPLVMLALNRIGIVSHKAFVTNWRYAILGVFVCAALFTPPDPFTQMMMAVPMVLLYLFGLILTSRSERRVGARRKAAQ